jgi:molybdopterin-guanine dinucleotide biosynthesis protein MobB
MKVISVAGTKKTGKTTLVSALVRSLKSHGKVGTVKNMAGHLVDQGDTRRHFDAGADEVIGLGDGQIKVTRGGTLASALSELQEDGMDFVLVEGFKSSSLPKIVLGEVEVSNTLRRVRLSDLNESLIGELTSLILELDDYSADDYPR